MRSHVERHRHRASRRWQAAANAKSGSAMPSAEDLLQGGGG
jgi:hypothetical protein